MWGMKQMPAALAQKRLNLNRHSNKGRHRSIRGRHRGLPLQQKKDRHISEQLFLINSLWGGSGEAFVPCGAFCHVGRLCGA